MRQLCCCLVSFAIVLVLVDCGSPKDTSPQTPTTHAATTTATTVATTLPPMPGPRTAKWIDLTVGQCLAELPDVELGEVDVALVDCAAQHRAEVYFRGPLTVNEAIPDVANRECRAQFPAYTGAQVDGGRFAITYLVDSNQDRTTIAPTTGPAPSTVICLLEEANGQALSGSARR